MPLCKLVFCCIYFTIFSIRIAIYRQKFVMILLFIVRNIQCKKNSVAEVHTSDCVIRNTQEKGSGKIEYCTS